MILRDNLYDSLNLHESKSHKLLTESVWRQLDEDTKSHINIWEKELWPLLEEYEKLTEAELTANQISTIFKDAETFAQNSGKYQTLAGKAGEKAAVAGKAVAGGVKLASGVVAQINAKINELGKIIQDTKPVQGLDRAFDKAKLDLNQKLGGKDSKINKAIETMAQAAKDNPGKTKFLIGLLTTAAAFAGGPAGGATAGFVLRLGNDLLAGDKLSTAVGKGAKTAALGFLAGKAFEFLSAEMKDMFASGTEAELASAQQALQDAKVAEYTADEIAKSGPAKDLLQKTFPDNKYVEFEVAQAGNKGTYFSGKTILTGEQYDTYRGLVRDASLAGDAFSEEKRAAMAKAYNYIEQVKANTDQLALKQIISDGKAAANAIDAAGRAALEDPALQAEIASLTGNAANDIAKVNKIADIAAALGQGAATAATVGRDNEKEPEQEPDSEEKAKESVNYELIYTKHMAGVPLNEAEQQIVNEIGLADIKKFASNAADKVSDAAKKAGGAVAGGVSTAAKELGNSITFKKLSNLWTRAKKPTDAQSVSNVLAQAGMEPGDVTQVSKMLPAPTQQRQAQGDQKQAGRPGIDKPADPNADPNAGLVRDPKSGRFVKGNQGGTQFAPDGYADQQKQQQQQQQAQGDAQDTPGQKNDAQGTTGGPTGGSSGGNSTGGGNTGSGGAGTGGKPVPKQGSQDEIKDGEKKKVNNIEYKWSKEQGEWLDPKGIPATGAMKAELMKQVGLDVTGKEPKKGFIGKAKDYMSGVTPGLGQKTRGEPGSIFRKAAGVAGAAVGGALAGGRTPKPQEPEQPGQPQQPQAQPDAQEKPQVKPLSPQTHRTLGALQQKVISTGDVEAAKGMVGHLSGKLKDGGDPAEISMYASAVAPVLKRNKEFMKNNPELYTHLVKLARSMRTEAYEHLCRVLEHANISWEDLGYKVSVTESNVMLLPLKELNALEESVSFQEMKNLAGI